MTSAVVTPAFRDTPARLAFQRNLLAVLIIFWGLATIGVLGVMRAGVKQTDRAMKQVSLVAETKVQLTRADSLATSGYLTGGLQSDQALAAFASDMASANTGLAAISRGVGGDKATATLGLINTYLTDVTAAQANNRQGWPVGATYQKTASTNLRTAILPSLDAVDTQARSDLVKSVQDLRWTWATASLFLLLVAIPLVLALFTLAAHSNRLVNLPVALALVVAFVAFIFTLTIANTTKKDTVNSIEFGFRNRDLVGQARVAAYNAKSNEALTLIARGSGQAYELQWRQNMSDLEAIIADDRVSVDDMLKSAVEKYKALHAEVRQLDDAGEWDSARFGVLGASGKASSSEFQALDSALSARVPNDQTGPSAARDLTVAQFIAGLAALVAAALTRVGFAQRLKEYQ